MPTILVFQTVFLLLFLLKCSITFDPKTGIIKDNLSSMNSFLTIQFQGLRYTPSLKEE